MKLITIVTLLGMAVFPPSAPEPGGPVRRPIAASTAADAAGQEQQDLATKLAGAWKRVGEPGREEWLGFFGDQCVIAHGTQQQLYAIEYGAGSIRRTPYSRGPVLDTEVEVASDRLTVLWKKGKRSTYERVTPVPESVLVEPIKLAKAAIDDAERDRVSAALRARAKRDQGVRVAFSRAMAAAQEGAKTPEAMQKAMQSPEMTKLGDQMRTTDAENTRYLAGLIKRVGWVDAERFGERAARDAFLIVQHSGNLRLMRTALPYLEADAKRMPKKLGGSFALLYDRTQLAMGRKQRYGSQLQGQPDGSLRLAPLEDPKRVDARREQLGMEPLEAYLDRFRRGGRKVHGAKP